MALERYSHSQDRGVIDRLNGSYLHWTKIQLKELHKHLYAMKQGDLTLKQNDQVKAKKSRTEILDLVHNIIGLGGSFGYYMITDIADSLNKYIRSVEEFYTIEPQVIAAHLNAMDYIIAGNIEGYGGKHGKKIMAQLQGKLPKKPYPLSS